MPSEAIPLTAYRLSSNPMPIEPAAPGRPWMNDTGDGFARRCLPLLIANQAGWLIHNTHDLTATWDGGDGQQAVTLNWHGAAPYPSAPALSHFGHGILTFAIPYLFRTPPGIQLHVRGPANYPKDGASPLEGIVETDWTVATFTMNWQLTRPGLPVRFSIGEAVCMITPVDCALLQDTRPVLRDLGDDREVHDLHHQWADGRGEFLKDLKSEGSQARQQRWQRDYFLGRCPDGGQAEGHMMNLRLPRFTAEQEMDGSCPELVHAETF